MHVAGWTRRSVFQWQATNAASQHSSVGKKRKMRSNQRIQHLAQRVGADESWASFQTIAKISSVHVSPLVAKGLN
jgi:hypothetical protein